jgi:hypothetical protein
MTPAFTSQAMKAMSATSRKRYQQGRACREGAKAHRVPACHLPKRQANDERNGGSNGNGGVARTAKDLEHQAAEQACVKAGFRRQVRKRRVA